MGIQPIDLQTMYSQLSNVAKSVSGAQQAQLTEAMQQQTNIQRSMENASKVQQTSNEKGNANSVNHNGSNSSSYNGKRQGDKDKKSESNDENLARPISSNPSYLGTIIDITR